MSEKMPPIHPGEILQELFLIPGGISPYRLAKGTGLTQTRIGQILQGKRGITAETALRLASTRRMPSTRRLKNFASSRSSRKFCRRNCSPRKRSFSSTRPAVSSSADRRATPV